MLLLEDVTCSSLTGKSGTKGGQTVPSGDRKHPLTTGLSSDE